MKTLIALLIFVALLGSCKKDDPVYTPDGNWLIEAESASLIIEAYINPNEWRSFNVEPFKSVTIDGKMYRTISIKSTGSYFVNRSRYTGNQKLTN